jgi:dihydrofolate synthase/folylpolyglutamate synthase
MTTIAAPSDRVLQRLMALHPKKIDLSLGRMERLLSLLGHPERKLPPVFHIAGTNGKGSTAAYLRAILEASGRRVHVYTSPHLVRFAERIRLAGNIIDEDALIAVLGTCERLNGPEPITFFEVTTAAAFLAFSRAPADALILEVGLGGRLDATNVIDRPLVTAITPVSMDHEQFLGNSLALIAAEKAGIAKKGCALVLGPQPEAALAVIRDVAAKAGARLFPHGNGWRVEEDGDYFIYADDKGRLCLPKPSLNGPHQIYNAGLAVACLRAQNHFAIETIHIKQGLQGAIWPARLQEITGAGGLGGFPAGVKIWLDGGHNPAAGKILSNTFGRDHHPLYLITGMLANKDAAGFFEPFSGRAAKVFTTAIDGEDCYTADDLARLAQSSGLKAETTPGFEAALDTLKKHLPPNEPGHILICGSLYLAGQVLCRFGLSPA